MMIKTKANRMKWSWTAVWCLLGFISAWPLPVEAAKILYQFKAWNGPPIRVFATRPVSLAPDRPVVFVMHGSERDALGYRDRWHDLANEYDFLLVVPEFRDRQFPGEEYYSLGNVFDDKGLLKDESGWSYAAIEAIFEDLHSRFGITTESFSLFGDSVGAEFVQRYVFHVPRSGADRIVAANAEQYLMPDFDEPYPDGLKGSGVDESQLAGALQQSFVVLLGTGDIDTGDADPGAGTDPSLPGPDRRARGEAFFNQARQAAEQLDVPFNWSLERVKVPVNDNRLLAPAAIPYLLDR